MRPLVYSLGASLAVAGTLGAQTEWPAYAHDQQGSKYSPAAQIDTRNVNSLTPAWTYRTGDYALGEATARDETTPIYVDGVLYVSTPFGGVRALDGDTGHELWSFDAHLDLSGDYGDPTNRGVSTWLDAKATANAACRRRIYVATLDARLIALDAAHGKPCANFGASGTIDLSEGLRNKPEYKGEYAVTSPPAVIGDLIVVGSAVADGHRANAPNGVVRAFDARTGTVKWAWNPLTNTSTGAANAWSVITADSSLGMVYVPTGSPSPDFYGGKRLGDNRDANSVVALDAKSGKRVWSFQVVHHDLWDYDVPAQPALFTMHRDGRSIPAMLVATKMGHLFVLDRRSGNSLFPIEERAVPQSDVAGERASATQPFPIAPAPLSPTHFSANDVFSLSDAGKQWCDAMTKGTRSEGIFTPPSLGGTVIFPGNIGGSNWSGVAIDPRRHIAIVPTNRIVTLVRLIPRDSVHTPGGGTRFSELGLQSGTPYAMRRQHLLAPDGVPCNSPPWGTLTAIDLETGAKVWEHPHGVLPWLVSHPESAQWGSPILGGGLITAGGLYFIGGTVDQRLYAYDDSTGAELWHATLPAGVHAAPMTYTTKSGHQFIVVAAGGHRELRDKAGDYVVAYALPDAPRHVMTPRVTSGAYTGDMIFDRTRLDAQWTLTIANDSSATLDLMTDGIHVEGHGTGRMHGDSLDIDVLWRVPSHKCGGTLHLIGQPANENSAIIGELTYVDGCTDGRTKPGTFAMHRQ